jgi:hypothetical protein
LTGRQDASLPGLTADAAELDALLAAGPFCEALRAAIRARGLSLERIQAKLAALGTPVSLATLSHWQSGRSQPERDASLLALGHLERLLGLPPRVLAALLEPPRRRGRRADSQVVDLVDVFHDKSAVAAALRDFDSIWSNALTAVSQHDRMVVGADGFIHSQWNRRVLRARVDGPDRMLAVYQTEGNTPRITAVRGCSLGRVVTDLQAGVVVAELLFGHRLRDGEFVVLEHRVDMSGPFAPDVESVRRLPQTLREHVVEVEFAASRRPARCLQVSSTAVDSGDYVERALTLDEFGRACAVALDVGPGQFGIRWEWPKPQPTQPAQPTQP